jgi:YHYH protein
MRKLYPAKFFFLFFICMSGNASWAQDPAILSSWTRNTTNYTGYNGILADVQSVRYSANYVYINSTGIPNYNIGPWNGNPNVPSNQSYVFKFSRAPVENTGAKTYTPLGAIGSWKNGVPIYNPKDAVSYNNQNIWHRNAVVVEGPSFDACKGHPAPGGRYHNHEDPVCLHDFNSNEHSPIIGYAFDGFPVYGPYGYSNPNGSGTTTRMRTSYRLRNITQRTTLPDGTVLAPNQFGPPVSATYPLGYYLEDYEYVANLGDLDQYNGRVCVTPEYPSGIYAYFVTNDANNLPEYPYIIGPQYYGVIAMENITTMGHVTVSESVQTYYPKLLNLNLLIEGLYDGVLNAMVSDSAEVYLRNFSSPYNLVDSSKGVVSSSGSITLSFSNAANGINYYVVVSHRNSIVTWSSTAVTFNNYSAVYDMSSSQSSAYGNNLKQKGSRFCIYSGDISRDGFIDISDESDVDNAMYNFVTGYVVSDLNGDNTVDLSDAVIAENNAASFVAVIRP